jgi:hypothetical protein
MIRNLSLSLVVIVIASMLAPLVASAQSTDDPLSHTRQLRRLYLSLLGHAPDVDDYQRLLAFTPSERSAFMQEEARQLLASPAFYDQARAWGNEYMGVPGYFGASNAHTYQFKGALSPSLTHSDQSPRRCPDDSLHAGRVGLFRGDESTNIRYGESITICDDPSSPTAETEPWWAPGTTIPTIGDVALARQFGTEGDDCGAQHSSFRSSVGCGCGPNLIYCTQRPISEEGDYYRPESMRRQVHEEPSRLFAHIVTQDLPFSDLVLGDYTVATRTLRMAYMRQARMTPDNASMDLNPWWRDYSESPDTWSEVPIQDLHPQLLQERAYRFDPRTEAGRPRGIPAAGVLTTLVANEAWPRERVRGAAWLGAFACREFNPPSSDVEFPDYERDPGREGPCLSCHQLIDPAAIFFKRPFESGGLIAGTTDTWSIATQVTGSTYRLKAHATGSMIHDTLMTPVSAETLASNSDARFIDFLLPGTTLLGQAGTGTIGPLGFGEIVVASGAFDECAVRRTYERFAGRDLRPGSDHQLLDELVTSFVASGRSMRDLITAVLNSPEMSLGI